MTKKRFAIKKNLKITVARKVNFYQKLCDVVRDEGDHEPEHCWGGNIMLIVTSIGRWVQRIHFFYTVYHCEEKHLSLLYVITNCLQTMSNFIYALNLMSLTKQHKSSCQSK